VRWSLPTDWNQSWQQCGHLEMARLQQFRIIDIKGANQSTPFAQQGPMARCPQHIHSTPTGPILGMREHPHGLAAQPSTGREKNPPS
jgi:hypothetical protein